MNNLHPIFQQALAPFAPPQGRQSGDFDSTIQGIPCQIKVTWATSYRNNRWGHIDSWLPDDEPEFEYNVLDRKGYPAPWLRAKITDVDDKRIYADWQKQQENQND